MNITIFLIYHGHVCLPSEPWHRNFMITYPMVIVNVIRDKDVGLFARAKRLANKGSIGYTDTKYNRDGALSIAGYLIKVNDNPVLDQP